ncbi:flagellar hook-length control protein FliK, partial [bacterium]|nr:flagellar hook-length control protein FliK [bacterium]
VEPFIQLSSSDRGVDVLPQSLRESLSEMVTKPNLFSEKLSFLQELLSDKTLQLPFATRNLLENLTARFSAANLINDLRTGVGLPFEKLGLFHEPEFATLLLTGTEREVRLAAGRQPTTVKESLMRLLAGLDGGPLEESLMKSGTNVKELVGKLRASLNSLLDMVELNQTLNNPGLRGESDFMLLLPLAGWGSFSDLWLQLTSDGGAEKSSGRSMYTLMIYLDLEALGPLGAQMVVGSQGLQVKILVVDEQAAQKLRKLLPEVRGRLRADFSGGLYFEVETIGPNAVEEFRQRAFLASLPPLLEESG